MLTEVQEARWSPDQAMVAAGPRRVGVTRLALSNFRNYRSERLALGDGPVVLTGPNGAGKTNLLEALSFLAPGRGLRAARLSEIDRRPVGGDPVMVEGWAVAAHLMARSGAVRIGTGRDPAGGERRTIRIDGETVRSQAALSEQLGIVWLTPQMDRLFVDGPAGRRRFLDRLVLAIDPAHAARVGAYEQALRERARLLRDGVADPGWLAALEEVMAAQGVAVTAARCDTVQRLDAACAEAEGPFPRARLALLGAVETWLDEMPALTAEARFAAALADARRNDALTGGAAVGPHRSDLVVTLPPGGVAAEFASTGEQKALLISIVLAHARLQRALRGSPPLLLLDEIAAHLDAGRRSSLFDLLMRLESQTWLTGTEEAMFAPLRRHAQFLWVHNGTVNQTCF
ncbi:MAG TPA: DNA replication/repair protein RecF [Stellaceae bacterium]|nr:DNA replication/repair protein RecF [Stellaceae bacterium]